jgi:hypothetical protein
MTSLVLNPDDTIAIGIDPEESPEAPLVPVPPVPESDITYLNRAFVLYVHVYVILTLYYNAYTIFCLALVCIGYMGYRYKLMNLIFVFLLVSIFLDLMLIVIYSLREIKQFTFMVYSILTTSSIRLIYLDHN